MDWTALGHASWLCEVEGLRLLLDPLLEARHHGGVLEVAPPRRLAAEALRADFVLVSHAHPDHFDLDSLATLARLDPDSVLVTPDPLVEWAGRELGFRTVRRTAPGQRVDLDGVTLLTTPSLDPDEWGLVVSSREGAAWNQVDTVLGGVPALRRVLETTAAALGRAPERALDLALVRWQPLLEVAAQLAEAPGFPYAAYAALLAELAALPPGSTLVPTACGARHTAEHAWLNRFVYPLEEERFLADLRALRPDGACCAVVAGDVLRVRGGAVTRDPGAGAALIADPGAAAPPARYDPFCAPTLTDPGALAAAERARLRRFLDEELPAALGAAARALDVARETPLRLALEVVLPDEERWAQTYLAGPGSCTSEPGLRHDHDALNRVTGSALAAVLAARSHWGDALLGGALQAVTRAYRVGPGGLERLPLAPIFLYYALPYDEAFTRSVRARVSLLRAAGAAKLGA
ncbi:MAG: MBL fold metallo-hydrolase [Planctomycetota bacterium]